MPLCRYVDEQCEIYCNLVFWPHLVMFAKYICDWKKVVYQSRVIRTSSIKFQSIFTLSNMKIRTFLADKNFSVYQHGQF